MQFTDALHFVEPGSDVVVKETGEKQRVVGKRRVSHPVPPPPCFFVERWREEILLQLSDGKIYNHKQVIKA